MAIDIESPLGHLKSFLAFDLFNRSLEPLPGRDQPKHYRVQHNNTHSDDSIIERLRVDGGGLRKYEDNRDKAYPQNGNDCNWVGEFSEVEGSPHKALAIPKAEGDRDSVRDV